MTVSMAHACTTGRAPISWLTSAVNAPLASLGNAVRLAPLPVAFVTPARAAVASVWMITRRALYAACAIRDSRQVPAAISCAP